MYQRTSLGIPINVAYLMIYLLPIAGSLFFLLFDFRDRDLRLHCLQTLYVALAVAVVHMVLGVLALIPFIGAFFTVLIWAMYIVYVFTMLIGMIRAMHGGILPIPFFYNLACRGAY